MLRDNNQGRQGERLRENRSPCDPPFSTSRRVGAIPAHEAFAGHAGRQTNAVVQPIFQSDKLNGARRGGIQRAKVEEFADDHIRVEAEEQNLNQIDGKFPNAFKPRQNRLHRSGECCSRILAINVEVPRRGQQCQRGNIAPSAMRQCQGKQSTHAIPDNLHGPAGCIENGIEGGFETAGNIVGQGKIALDGARFSPIHKERAQPGRGKKAQQAALFGKIDDVRPIDERRDDQEITRTALPTGVFALQWMHDSGGLGVVFAKRTERGCTARAGLRVLRDDGGGKVGWNEWNLPDTIELLRGDQPWLAPLPTDDAMHWLGVEARGVVLIEPVPRFRGRLALIAPPSQAWPKVRPGTRPQASLVGGPARLSELLMETGDLDAAEDELAKVEGKIAAPALVKLKTRLAKLVDVRSRRAAELGVGLDEMRSKKGQPPPKPLPLPLQETATDAVEPAAAPTPVRP